MQCFANTSSCSPAKLSRSRPWTSSCYNYAVPVRLQRAGAVLRNVAQAASSSEPVNEVELDPRLAKFKVLVAGATGGVGKNVVQQLQAKGVRVRALVRDLEKGAKVVGKLENVDFVKGDVYQFATLREAIEDCNAVICCTGANDFKDPLAPFNVDYVGTTNLVVAARQLGVKKFVLVSSIGADEILNPLNLFWGVLFWKKRGEEEVQRSDVDYTIVRPGGLKNALRQGESKGNIVMEGANTLGTPPAKKSGSILRSQVAEVCIEALVEPAASNKVVEIIAEPNAPAKTISELFASVKL